MATIRKLKTGKWQAQVRRKGNRSVSKTLTKRVNAASWARDVESEIERGLHLDFRMSERTTVGDVLKHYARKIMPSHKGANEERYRVKRLRRHLGALSLTAASPKVIAEYRDQRLTVVGPAAVRRELTVIRQSLK